MYKPGIVVVAEPFTNDSHMCRLQMNMKMMGSVSNEANGGKIWIFWAEGVKINVLKTCPQSLTIRAEEGIDPWMVVGDFNIIRKDEERKGGRPRHAGAMADFNSFIEDSGLVEMNHTGNTLSWCNGQHGLSRSWARLDRVLINTPLLLRCSDASMKYLPRLSSDHSPMIAWWKNDNSKYGFTSFKYQKMWESHANFRDCVSRSWVVESGGVGMNRLARKLKTLKCALRAWNKNVFGLTIENIKALEDRVEALEESLQEGFNEEIDLELMISKLELDTWVQREETHLAQQAKQSWLKSGEANVSFFRAMNARNGKVVREMRLSDGRWLRTPEEVHEGAVQYFKEFLGTNHICNFPNLSNLVEPVITEGENKKIMELPSILEVKDAVFSIPSDSSPGLDGFESSFYKSCWELISVEVVEAVHDFFRGNPLPRFFATTSLVLIPKIANLKSFEKFRPISLCSVFYKICTKILVARISPLLSRFISPEQGAPIPGRSIFDNISLTQEMTHGIHKPTRGGNVLIKIDMAKAYDSIEWGFLIHVLCAFGFSMQFCDLIKSCVSSPWFSVTMNGVSKGFFKGERGLRQGDPISPYLFIVVEDIFSRLLKGRFQQGLIRPYHHHRNAPLITHLLYADDIVIFANGNTSSLKNISKALEVYENGRAKRLKGIHFDDFLGKIRDRIGGWQANLLSSGAQTLLLKHVLGNMPIYLLSILQVPKSIIRTFNRYCSNFFWGLHEGKPKKHWRAWEGMCCPEKEGGIGLRNLEDIKKSLHMKFSWKLLTEDNLWSWFFKSKYVKNSHISLLNPSVGTSFWRMVIRCIPEILHLARWRVKEGNLSFWCDTWLEEGPLCNEFSSVVNLSLKIKECTLEDGWNYELLNQLVGPNRVEQILKALGKRKNGADVLVWTPSPDGVFSTKSAWECVRIKMPTDAWASWVWHPYLPKFMATTMWKGLHGALSVDDRLRRIGIPIVSKCNCCNHGAYEDLNHVLAEGDFAKSIWRKSALQVGMNVREGRSWKETIGSWFNTATKSSTMGNLIGIIPSIITWRLWLRRCKTRMEGSGESVEQVWRSIRFWITKIGEKLKAGKKLKRRDEVILKELNVPPKMVTKRTPQVVKWFRPYQGRYKLNTDGSSRGNPGQAGGGGVIRNSSGNLVRPFAVSLDQGIVSFAEFMAVYHGVKLAKSMGIVQLDIELDSSTVIKWLKTSLCGLWYVEDFWEERTDMLRSMNVNITHVYREANTPADLLARMGLEGCTKYWDLFSYLPWKLRGLLKMDKTGLPYIRDG
ncbi:uncharacterized protein LOC122299013 [Carya illinoinensis]|uniref:uncharacterized protein LOC122299013 n=1 Tax=Carya illinoinensis TaxID=32201 RepID=UPI001C720449|nr:uncharacterized protein LOC122299013 [Carya illinoinensis]